MDRMFRIINVSSGPGVVRTPIPFGASSSLPPGTAGRRRGTVKRGRHVAIVPERVLRTLVGFIRRRQLLAVALDGGPLPEWIFGRDGIEETQVAETPLLEVHEGEEEVLLVITAESILNLTAKEAVAEIETISNMDLLADLLRSETDGKNRKTVIVAIEAQIGGSDEG